MITPEQAEINLLREKLALAVEALEVLMSDEDNCGCEAGNYYNPEYICGGHKALFKIRGMNADS